MSEAAAKALSTLTARAALLGYVCTRTDAENVVMARFGGAWIFGSVEKAAEWLDRIDQPSTEVQP